MFIYKGLKYILLLTIGVVGLITITFYLDNDVVIHVNSYLNLLMLIFIYLLLLLFVYFIEIRRIRKWQSNQIQLISKHVLSKKFKHDPLISTYHQYIKDQQQLLLYQTNMQTKWMHDLKLPLSTLKLFIENRKDALSQEDLERLNLIYFNFETLISKRIMYDKIHYQMHDFHITSFDIKPLILDVIKEHKTLCQLKQLSIDVKLVEPFMITSDEQSIRFCLQQLLLNAIKYADKQTTIIFLRQNNELMISNTGVEISSQDLPYVFNQGFTGENGKASGLAATGLGLYLVKKQLQTLEHDIQIESYDHKTFVTIMF